MDNPIELEAKTRLAEILTLYRGPDSRTKERIKRIQSEIAALTSANLSKDQLIAECATFKTDLLMTIERYQDIMNVAKLGIDTGALVEDKLVANKNKLLSQLKKKRP